MSVPAYFGQLFLSWTGILVAPLRNFDLLWITIPVYVNWIFTEIYQEKKGTSFGNAISNGVVPLWVGVDWARVTLRMFSQHEIAGGGALAVRIGIIIFMLAYGMTIIILGIKVEKIIHYVGRIREVTYVSLMLTPVFYGVVALSASNLLAMLIFFPIFYAVIELICRITPNPSNYDEDEMPSGGSDIPMSESSDVEIPALGDLGLNENPPTQ